MSIQTLLFLQLFHGCHGFERSIHVFRMSSLSGLWLFSETSLATVRKPGALRCYKEPRYSCQNTEQMRAQSAFIYRILSARSAVEYVCPESVGNPNKISLALALQFMFSSICSVLIFQSMMHRYLL